MNLLESRFKEVEEKIKELLTKAFYSKKSNGQIRNIVKVDLEKLIKYLENGSNSYVKGKVLGRIH